jgi:hypothetical protein
VSAWFGLVGGVCMVVSGIVVLMRRQVKPPGNRENGAGLVLIGLGVSLGALRAATGWSGTTANATTTASLVCLVLGLVLGFRVVWIARAARRSTGSA